MSARQATRTLLKLGLSARVDGVGFVISQQPPPGTPFEGGEVCRVQLGRLPAAKPAEAEP